jgi:S-DNA-T family DNA segregation ATPase FtsK/SpoIIIE
LKPAEGIKLSRILGLQNDLSLALAAHPLRIEAPIPGKSLVGIEIPNATKLIVGLRDLVSNDVFQESQRALFLALGKDVAGKPIYSDLTKMPHLLIAGATGAGKSIAIHSIITSLLYRNSPESLRFIMVDPKRVELTVYNKIPHILAPVITDAKKAILTLKWACKEMERRYEVLLKEGTRDIDSYHKKCGGYNSMPYLVIVIDELADLMSTYPREMESSVVRLAQMSRAVGIHLIISTQRPSVEVITGLIKANVPARIALQVSSQIDSRTILDSSGAEKLLGKGDMLFLTGDIAKPRRIQGPFISEKEIKRVVNFISEEYKNIDIEEIIGEDSEMESSIQEMLSKSKSQESLDFGYGDDGDDDDLYEDAREIVIEAEKASTSYLQRKLKVGYARAARLMDMLEERGVVGEADGSKPREVLIKGNEDREDEIDEMEENEVDF